MRINPLSNLNYEETTPGASTVEYFDPSTAKSNMPLYSTLDVPHPKRDSNYSHLSLSPPSAAAVPISNPSYEPGTGIAEYFDPTTTPASAMALYSTLDIPRPKASNYSDAPSSGSPSAGLEGVEAGDALYSDASTLGTGAGVAGYPGAAPPNGEPVPSEPTYFDPNA